MVGRSEQIRENYDRFTAVPLFFASALFLFLLAGALHLSERNDFPLTVAICHWGMALLSPLFIADFLVHFALRSPCWRQRLLCCFLPPLRIGGRDLKTGRSMWFPRSGWLEIDGELRRRAEKAFSVPMLIIALMVLPLMATEYVWSERIASNNSMAYFIHAGTALIWLAFTFEFVVMISIVERKARYCKEHWIDLAVICLPLIAFLRAARLGRLMRLNSLVKTARIYRLRGLLMRLYRAVLVLEVIERLVRKSPPERLAQLREELEEKEQELEALRREITELEAIVAAEEDAVTDAA